MTDLQKLFFEDEAKVSDKEMLVAARLNGRVRVFLGKPLSGTTLDEVGQAIVEEMDRMVAERVLRKPIDWLAVVVKRRLQVAYGSRAVQQLSRELREQGLV